MAETRERRPVVPRSLRRLARFVVVATGVFVVGGTGVRVFGEAPRGSSLTEERVGSRG